MPSHGAALGGAELLSGRTRAASRPRRARCSEVPSPRGVCPRGRTRVPEVPTFRTSEFGRKKKGGLAGEAGELIIPKSIQASFTVQRREEGRGTGGGEGAYTGGIQRCPRWLEPPFQVPVLRVGPLLPRLSLVLGVLVCISPPLVLIKGFLKQNPLVHYPNGVAGAMSLQAIRESGSTSLRDRPLLWPSVRSIS